MDHDDLHDLTEWRARRRPERIPAEVLAEVELAGRLSAALTAQGFRIAFDHEGGARVRAELRSEDGSEVRELSLLEVIGVEDPPPPAAA